METTQISSQKPVTSPEMISITLRPDGVAVLTYDVPGEAVNTLRVGTAEALEKALAAVEADPAVAAVVIASGKKDSFIVGADIAMLRACRTAADAEALCREAQAGFERLARSRKPVVAAIHGPCLGGGFELALACQGRVASSDGKTAVGLPEVQLGLLPGADGLQRVADLTSIADALDLGLTGKNLRAERARKMGLVDEVVPAAILLDAAAELALALAQGKGPKKKAPPPGPSGCRSSSPSKTTLWAARCSSDRGEGPSSCARRPRGKYPAPETASLEVIKEAHASGLHGRPREVEAQAFGELVVSECLGAAGRDLLRHHRAQEGQRHDDVTRREAAPGDRSVGMLGGGLHGRRHRLRQLERCRASPCASRTRTPPAGQGARPDVRRDSTTSA
jgi:3-hydroxyacyl-CoA dehydrogenase/enoyl-CoA hydratase/3-hydroxybutyryl-CoA epimerase